MREDLQFLKENLTTLLNKVEPAVSSKSPLKGFVKPIGVTTEQGILSDKRTVEGFGPKAIYVDEKIKI